MISHPAVNAILNGSSAILVTAGYVMIRSKRIQAHKACMLAATATSTVFLISYVEYHLHAGVLHFPGHGAERVAYLSMLTSHTILAIAIVPLVIISLVASAQRKVRRPQTYRALDVADLGVCFCDGRASLRLAISSLRTALN